MSEIQEINLNKAKVNLANSDDSMALQVSWRPTKISGASFKSQKMSKTRHKVVIKNTSRALFLALVFAISGIWALFIGSRYFFIHERMLDGFLMMVWGILFGGFGLFLLTRNIKFSIDKRKGVYFRSRGLNIINFFQPKQRGKITDIYALQLISEQMNSRANHAGAKSFTSFELNMVLKDGKRIHLMDHGNGKDVENAAKILSEFLSIPILKAHY